MMPRPSKNSPWLAWSNFALPRLSVLFALAYFLGKAVSMIHICYPSIGGFPSLTFLQWWNLCFVILSGSTAWAYFKILQYLRDQSSAFYRALIENSSDMSAELSIDGSIKYTSPAITKMLGYGPDELVGRMSFDLIHPDDLQLTRQVFETGIRSPGVPQSCEYRFKHKDGSWRILESMGSSLAGSPEGINIIITSRDVTERRALTDKLRLLQMAADTVSDGIVVCDARDPDMPLRYINPAFEKMTGYSEAEALGKNPRFLQRENRNQPGLDIIRQALKKGEGCNAVLQNYRKDGTMFWNEIRIRPVHDENGQLTHYVGIKTDVTERIHAHQEIKESEERFRQLAENIPEVFWLRTLDLNQMIYVNPSYERIFGRTRESLYKDPRSFTDAIHPEDRPRLIAATQRLGENLDEEYRILRPDGEIRWIHVRGIPVRDISGKAYRMAGIAEDITEIRRVIDDLRQAKKKLEEAQSQLIQSEKLAGIGQLAAGVAHELNNPLSGVMGFSQLLLDDNHLNAQQRKDVETIQAQSQRCKVIIQNLLQFSRKKEPKKEAVDLISLLQLTLNFVKYDFSTSGVEIIQKMPASLPLVFGDSNQLQQVFLNLLTNARQAMEGRPNGHLIIEGGQSQSEVFLRFKDTGPGIPKEIQNKIFDPFFTTKPVGKGTGLGLSICYGIVEQHHGKLRVESAAGEGATFTLELPIYE